MTQLGRQCKEFASRFTWNKNVELLERIIQDTVAESSRTYRRRSSAIHNARSLFYELYFQAYNVLRHYPSVVRFYKSLLVLAASLRNFPARLNYRPELQTTGSEVEISPVRRISTTPRSQYQQGLVSICILTKNKLDLIKPCLEAIVKHTNPNRAEILVGDTGTTEREVLDYYRTLPDAIRVFSYDFYHFSKNNNELAGEARGEFVLFLNNDTRVTEGWLESLCKPFEFTNLAVAGPKMLFEDGSIQHAGVEISTRDPYRYIGWHPYAGFAADYPDANYAKAVPGVTGACVVIRHDVFDRFGGFPEIYQEECQDLDLCLQVGKSGYRIVYIPESCIYHYENRTRTIRESAHDRDLFRRRWKNYIDSVIFSRPQQSVRWEPLVCVIISGDENLDDRNIEQVIRLGERFPELAVTVKAKTLDASLTYNDVLEKFRLRNITVDYEDNVRYDHVLV
jgi:GT2 family glycosyltransferase